MTSALLIFLAQAFPGPLSGTTDLGLRHEPGVETRLLLAVTARYPVQPLAAVSGHIALAALDNSGLASFGLGLHLAPLPRTPAAVELNVTHDQWPDWQAGENRFSGVVTAEPVPGLQLGFGAAWRVPLSDGHWSSPFVWRSDWPEWNLAYRIRWRFLNLPNWRVAAFAANLDGYGMPAAQQLPVGIEVTARLKHRLSLYWRIASSIKGLSGPLISLGDADARIGVAGTL